MSSELIVDELTGRASAGSIAVTAEGGTVTTNLQQGLCKAWVLGTDAAALTDSFNTASGTDNGTGEYTYAFTNAMATANIAGAGATTDNTDQNVTIHSAATGSYRAELYNQAGNNVDRANRILICGDLA